MVFRYLRQETGAAVALIANVSDASIRSLTASRSIRRQKASFLKTLDWTSFLGRISKVAVSLKTRWKVSLEWESRYTGGRLRIFADKTPVSAMRDCGNYLCHYQTMQPRYTFMDYRTIYYVTCPTCFGLLGRLQEYHLIQHLGERLSNKCFCHP
jgi:hypothetical protein